MQTAFVQTGNFCQGLVSLLSFFSPWLVRRTFGALAPGLRLAVDLNTCLPSSALWLPALSEVLLCFVKDKGKGSHVWARSKSRAIASLSSLMPSTMHACCVYCSSMLPALLTCLSLTRPPVPRLKSLSCPALKQTCPNLQAALFPFCTFSCSPVVCEMGDFKHRLHGRLQSAMDLSSRIGSFPLDAFHGFLFDRC